MGYERGSRGTDWRGDDYQRDERGGDYGAGRNSGYSSAREYEAGGAYDRDDARSGQRGYGSQQYGSQRYGQNYGQSYGGYDRGQGRGSYGSTGGADRGQARYARGDEYHGSYASDGRRFEDVGGRRDWDDDDRDRTRSAQRDPRQGRSYGGQPQGYDYQDRGFFQRAGDEVRSWFGDEDAERRRDADNRYEARQSNERGAHHADEHYHNWRAGQIAAFDRDYHEYRQENRAKFENEFTSWRTSRQGQRASLDQVKEHAEVVGSDGSHVGTVDKVRGDRIVLTKSDADAGGRHHSVPSSWVQSVDDKKVTLSKTAEEAKKHWRDEESNQALFGDGDKDTQRAGERDGQGNLNRSFSGTY